VKAKELEEARAFAKWILDGEGEPSASLKILCRCFLELEAKYEALEKAARKVNKLLNEWPLIRQHCYAHEDLSAALKQLTPDGARNE